MQLSAITEAKKTAEEIDSKEISDDKMENVAKVIEDLSIRKFVNIFK